jgi:hypothetical protein
MAGQDHPVVVVTVERYNKEMPYEEIMTQRF